MATTPLQRVMFIQGQLCFFCNRGIPSGEASVEHLVPTSAGGSDHPDNLVACCRTLNSLFGSMNVKEKIRAILRQNGKFSCPNLPLQQMAAPKMKQPMPQSTAPKQKQPAPQIPAPLPKPPQLPLGER